MPRTKKTWRKQKGDKRFLKKKPEDSNQRRLDEEHMELGSQSGSLPVAQVDITDLGQIPLDELQARVRYAQHASRETQLQLLRVAFRRFFSYEARDAQVEALHSLVFQSDDTILIAQTGYGKSSVFHAFTLLTGKVTIMILPLLNLGAEQCKKIACFEGARPCEVTGHTKSRDPSLFDCIEKLHYNYILLGPEQVVAKEFKQILKSPSFNSQLGLIVVDEAHLTRQWASFRVAYTYLHLLRDLLPPGVPLLACSATLDPTTLEAMKKHVGIKDRGMHIIRTSVDRPDIAIIIQPIQKNKVSTFIDLYFILRGAVDGNKRATPENIPKTVIFLDNINLIHDCAAKLQEWLVEMTKDCVDETKRFTYAKAAACIRVYHSRVGPCDQEDIYRIFRSDSSSIRIVVASTCLGMGIDLLDVMCVVQYGLTILRDLCDLWQRFGRAVRAPGLTGRAFFFVEHWALTSQPRTTAQRDAEMARRNDEILSPLPDLPGRSKTRRKQRNSMRGSTLRHVQNASDLPSQNNNNNDNSDNPGYRAVSDDETASQQDENEPHLVEVALSEGADEAEILTKAAQTEKQRRDLLPGELYDFLNSGKCYRKVALQFFNEKLHDQTLPRLLPPAAREECCSICNPNLREYEPVPQTSIAKTPAAIRKGSAIYIALTYITLWCEERHREIVKRSGKRVWFDLPVDFIFPLPGRSALARVFRKFRGLVDEPAQATAELREVVGDWRYLEEYGEQLALYIAANVEAWESEYRALKEKKRTENSQDDARTPESRSTVASTTSSLSAEPGLVDQYNLTSLTDIEEDESHSSAPAPMPDSCQADTQHPGDTELVATPVTPMASCPTSRGAKRRRAGSVAESDSRAVSKRAGLRGALGVVSNNILQSSTIRSGRKGKLRGHYGGKENIR